MNRALWKKALGEVRLMLPCFVVLMFGFQILFVWLTSQVDLQYIQYVLQHMPEYWKRLLPVSVASVSTYVGRVAIGYDHPVVVFGIAFWAVARGSDAVSGPLGRGTLEMVLAQPVRRVSVLLTNAAMTTLGTAAIAAANWAGTFAGLRMFQKMRNIPAFPYAGCALNLFCYALFLAAVTTLLSACDRYRSRTVGLAVGFYIGSLVLKVIGRVSSGYHALLYGSFLAVFEPQRFVDPQFNTAAITLRYDVPLALAGCVCYLVAILIFSRRDLPAPL
jgi:ABC-2 type transport system permease protein